MFKIKIETYVNGYSLVVYDDSDGFIVRELADTKLEIMNTMLGIISKLAMDERKKLEEAV